MPDWGARRGWGLGGAGGGGGSSGLLFSSSSSSFWSTAGRPQPPIRTDRSSLPGTFAAEAAAREAERDRRDLSLAHLLLPLLNLTDLTTAALLDAHPGVAPSEAMALVRLHQQLYCR